MASDQQTAVVTMGAVNDHAREHPLRVLILEDESTDAEIMQRALRSGGFVLTSRVVDTRDTFAQALHEFHPDIVLLDYHLPAFDGLTAVRMARQTSPDLPLIVVTGALRDEEATELLKAGARDFVLKDRMARLASAVDVALADAMRAQRLTAAEGSRDTSDELIRAITTSAQDAIIMMDNEERISFWNASAEKIFGFRRDEALGRDLHTLIVPERYREKFLDGIGEFKETGQGPVIGKVLELEARRKDGIEFPVELSLSAVKLGEHWRAIGIIRDVTERKRSEREREKYFRFFKLSTDAMCIADPFGCFRQVNPAFTQMTGFAESELVSKPFLEFVVPEDRQRTADEMKQQVAVRPSVEFENRYLRKDGTAIDLSWTAYFDKCDGVTYATARDITAHKRSKRALKTLSRGNEALVHAANEQQLLQQMCNVLVEAGGYAMARIGFAEHDEAKTVRPVAWAGHETGYLEAARISWADTEHGQGPPGTAIRTGEPQINRNFATCSQMVPWRTAALERGYASSVALPLKIDSGIIGALTIDAAEADAFDGDELHLLAELADDLAYGIAALRVRAEGETASQALRESMEATIAALAATVELRDPYTAGHQRNVALLAAAIARDMGLPEHDIEGIRLAGVVHDVGKMSVPTEILSKPGKLTKIEFEFVKTHAQAGHDIVKGVVFPWPVAQMILQHHERLDGSGYPNGLKADAIITGSRILAVADVVEAMMGHRPYRAALGLDAALAEVEAGKGTRYDAAAVDACINLFRNKGFRLV